MTGAAHADWFGAVRRTRAMPPGLRGRSAAPPRDVPRVRHCARASGAFATRTGAVPAGASSIASWRVGQKLPISSRSRPRGRRPELSSTPASSTPRTPRCGAIPTSCSSTSPISTRPASPARQTGCISSASPIRGARHRRGDRPGCELAGRDEDAARRSSPSASPSRSATWAPSSARMRGVLHAPAPDRQCHGAVDPRAHPGAGDSQDVGFSDGKVTARARRGPAPDRARRGPRHGGGRGSLAVRQQSTGAGSSASSARTWVVAAGLATAVALAIGLPPAVRARRLRIVDALAGHR